MPRPFWDLFPVWKVGLRRSPMGLFTVRSSSNSTHQSPFEKPRKKKKKEKVIVKNGKAVSVQISYSGEPKFKNFLNLKRELEKEVYYFQISGNECLETKELLFEEYMKLYGRPLVLKEDAFSILDNFISHILTQPSSYFHTQTDLLTQEHLKLI
jgi:hypothetical protein